MTKPVSEMSALELMEAHSVAQQGEIERLTRDNSELRQNDGAIQRRLTEVLEDGERARAAFKNFHRLLCERFAYGHDEVDWERDQLSLIEWIATHRQVEPSVTRLPVPGSKLARISDLADDLIRELRRQGLETLQAVFQGVLLRVEPYKEPEKSKEQRDYEAHEEAGLASNTSK